MSVSLLSDHTFRALFADERDGLFRFLYRLTGNASDAEDLLQDTFLTIWRKRDQFEGRGSVQGYLRRTGYRLFLNRCQVTSRRAAMAPTADPDAQEPPADRELEHREAISFLHHRLREALATLPSGPREAFLMFRYENLTCAQISEVVGAPAKTIESRVRRATELLAEKLRPYENHLPVA